MSRRADAVLASLRSDIVAGVHPAGARLVESALCRTYDVSRVPVREALKQLEVEGFVTSVAYAGVRVARLDRTGAEDVFAVRRTIEQLTARRAAERCRDDAGSEEVSTSLTLLDELLVAGREGLATPDLTDLPPLNTRFHLAIADLAGNSSLLALLRQIAGTVEWLYAMDVAVRGEHSWEEHAEIADAVRAGRPGRASDLMGRHLRNSLEGYLSRHTP